MVLVAHSVYVSFCAFGFCPSLQDVMQTYDGLVGDFDPREAKRLSSESVWPESCSSLAFLIMFH